MIDLGTLQVTLPTIQQFFQLWQWLQKNLAERIVVKSDRFLEYDPGELRSHYASERPVMPALTYTLLCDLNRLPDPVRLETSAKQFTLSAGRGPWAKTVAAGYHELLSSGRIKDNECQVRVTGYEVSATGLTLKVQPATYHDQARSNLILDFDRDHPTQHQSLRAQLHIEYGTNFPDLSDRKLANTLGAALLVFYRSNGNWVPYMVRRAAKIGVFPGGIHCSASGAVKWASAPAEMTFDQVTRHLLDEAHEEIGLLPKDLLDLQPVAFCREMGRGGKPQLFYCARTHLSRKELAERRIQASRLAVVQKLWTEIERDRWYRSADIVMTSSRLRYGLEKWGVTLEGAAALYFGTLYLDKLAG